ncbi:MAG: DUF1080 domain-containing protein [Bacteroidota bacterium]
MRDKTTLFLCFLALLTACGDASSPTTETDPAPAAAPPPAPPTSEWTTLFNGEDYTGWHRYGGDPVGSAWTIDDGAMYFDPSKKGENGGGDIITDEAYANYELELEWKIGECGNSGIIYNVKESAEFGTPWLTGPEMQVLDNTCHPDAKIETHRAGDLYDMIAVAEENVHPAGEWNQVKLVVTDGKVEHWLNGKMQVEYPNAGPEWKAMIADSKFKDFESFGAFTSGKISLQDHNDPVWFRNIRIREISK